MSAIGLRRVNPSRWLVAAALAVIVQLVCTKTPPSEFLSFDDSVEYPPPDAQGNPEMFSSLPLAPEAETQLQTHTDTHYRTLPIPPTSHEGDEDIDAAIQHLSVVVHEQPEIEEINSALLEAATGCTMPRVSMANPVLTDGAHWKVFAKCVLQTTPQGQLLYGFVPELQQYGSAAGLMWSMNQLALLKHKMWQRPNAEKLNYLERLVVATRFRLPTLAEKNAAAAAIEENGIVNASFIYLMNWYYSLYYQKHFDYAKRPSPRYSSYIVSGRFVNAQNQNLQGVKYSVPIEFLAGYVLKGITGANGAINLQLFQPQSQLFADRSLILRAEKDSLQRMYTRTLNFPIVIGLKFTLSDTIEAPAANEVWPRANIARNAHTEALGFGAWGDGASCIKPDTVAASGVFDPAQYMRFIDCKLGSFQSRYPALLTREDALTYVQMQFVNYLNSPAAVYKGDLENLDLLFSLLTFRETTPSEKNRLTLALQNGSVDSVSSDMLLSWYYSSAYNKFDFSKEQSLALRNIRFTGTIKDTGGAPLTGITVSLLNRTSFIAGTETQNGTYDFTASVEETHVIDPQYELQVLSLTHATQKASIVFDASTTALTHSFQLPPVGEITPLDGGEVRRSDASISILFPPGAVTHTTQFNVSSLMTEAVANGTALRFEVTPSYTFAAPVTLHIQVPEAAVQSLTPGASLLAATLGADGNWELLQSLSWPKINGTYKTYTATTRHFSAVYLLPSNLLTCRYAAENKIVCQTNMAVDGISPYADVAERRQWIDTPYEIPSLRSYAKSYLDGRGWDGSLLDDLSNFNLQPFESVHIPESCLTAPCNSIALPTDSIQYGYPGLTLSNKSASGSAWVDAQVEHCAANPTISFPQSRLNAVQATDLRASTDFALQKNMSVGCDRRDCRRVCFIFCGTICLSYPGICTLEFSATGHVDVGKNMPLAKAAANDWRTVAENLANVNYSFTWYAKLVGGVNQSQGNSYFNQTVEALRNQLVTTGREIGRGMGESFRSAVNNAGIHDPVFNEDNCFVTTNPQDTVVFQPANGTGGIPLISTISLTFSEAILPHSLQVSTTHDCTGNVLLSSDNFATCMQPTEITDTFGVKLSAF